MNSLRRVAADRRSLCWLSLPSSSVFAEVGLNWPGGKGGVVDKAEQLLRVTDGNQPLHRQLKA